jgi:hypothetical protein
MRAVLDEQQAVALADLREPVHVRHRARQVDRHDGLGARADRRLDGGGIQTVGIR